VVPEEIVERILDEARSSRARLLVLSSEDFESLGDPEALSKLRDLFAGIPIEIVVYLRRQDDAIFAVYNQRVKSFSIRFCGTLKHLAHKPQIVQRFDYWSLIERWAAVFGDDAMRVRIYDPDSFPGRNIIPDFLS